METDPASPKLRTAALVVLGVAALAAGLYFGRDFFVPIAFAFLLNALFRPVARRLERLRMPTALAAAVVVLALTALLVGAGFALSYPLQSAWQNAPQTVERAQQKLERFRKPVRQVNEVASRLRRAASSSPTTTQSSNDNAGGAGEDGKPPAEATPAPVSPGLVERFFGGTTRLIGGVTEVLVLLYLLLASGDLFLNKLVRVMPLQRDKKNALDVVDEAQSVVMRYLWVTLLINLCQGTIVGLILWMLGVGHPLMWGVLTVVAEFVPYLGAAAMMVLLLVAGAATFDSPGKMLLPPLAYLVITTLQNNVVSPYAYGNRLKLNPVAVLLGVLLWWFLWGTPGAFLAVPMVAVIKIVAGRTEGLEPVCEFLSE